ncbi:hypothetical protein LOTGIDRAFT_161717 [Lottia gigantea]|uniref:Uncharacterized protein n=1 Tax=Lottia gigantea TaxID=225164 RepID=V4AA17_LOTGI|nr:hypothetical protein LOTGIDRAFT_161717 [Lottia gigantea]ESO93607.1 hypothetical protein LOTGIDRAFT_161717 [Lottia gigantea]
MKPAEDVFSPGIELSNQNSLGVACSTLILNETLRSREFSFDKLFRTERHGYPRMLQVRTPNPLQYENFLIHLNSGEHKIPCYDCLVPGTAYQMAPTFYEDPGRNSEHILRNKTRAEVILFVCLFSIAFRVST